MVQGGRQGLRTFKPDSILPYKRNSQARKYRLGQKSDDWMADKAGRHLSRATTHRHTSVETPTFHACFQDENPDP
jgi:hypothetical protein